MFQRGNSLVTVVGAARDLPRGTVITRSDVVAVEVGTLPAAAKSPSAT
jgi:flagella basal body P-ring formation protein FlgA